MCLAGPSGVTKQGIAQANDHIRPYIRRTPVIEIDGADFGLAACHVSLKLELLQHAGSFKTRGAFANLLLREVPKAGVVAASGGNHGVAVAYAARRLGKPARIFVPSVASPAKISRIRECGADLVVTGERYADALEASRIWAASSGALQIHAFDQVETLLGQGTVALEFDQQVTNLDTLPAGFDSSALSRNWRRRSHAPWRLDGRWMPRRVALPPIPLRPSRWGR
jgi:threonine dehydratase